MVGFCDVDWAGDHTNRKIQTGILVYFGNVLVSWNSKKQTVSTSSMEAEYCGIATTVQELELVKSLLFKLGVRVNTPMTIHCDNLGATYLSSNPIYHAKTKHMAIELHFVRERIEDKCWRSNTLQAQGNLPIF